MIRLGWVTVILLFLIAALRFSLTTDPVRNWVKNYTVNAINSQLNANLSIGYLSGDLWRGITLEKIQLNVEDEATLASIDSVHATYSIWSFFSDQMVVSDLNVYKPVTHLEQQNGRWNMENLIKPTPPPDTTSSVFPFRIDHLSIAGGELHINGDSLALTTPIEIANIELFGNLDIKESDFEAKVEALDFEFNHIAEGKKVFVESAATFKNKQLTLEELQLSTAESSLRSSGLVNLSDSTVELALSANPLSFQDLVPYSEELSLQQEIEAEISLTGSSGDYKASLQARSKDIYNFNAEADLKWAPGSGSDLERLQMQADRLDLQSLLGDTTLPAIEELDLNFTGNVPLADYQQSKGDLELTIAQLAHPSVTFNQIESKAQLQNQELAIDFQAMENKQKLSSSITIQQVWGNPGIRGEIRAQRINPGYWSQNEMLDSEWDIVSTFFGAGWYPEESPWKYHISAIDHSKNRSYNRKLSMQGQVNMNGLTTKGRLNLGDGLVKVDARLNELQDQPTYNFNLGMDQLDLGEVFQIDSLQTSLNGSVSGKGTGFTPADMQLNLALAIDSSVVNKESIYQLDGKISVIDTVAEVKGIELSSMIADGMIKGQRHLQNPLDPDNRFNINLRVKDISSLAPLMGVDTVAAEGTVNAELHLAEGNDLQMESTFELSNIVLDELFTTKQAHGDISAVIKEKNEYALDINLISPVISDIQLHDVWIKTAGEVREDETAGNYELRFSGTSGEYLEQRGQYAVSDDSTNVRISEFDIVSPDLVLSLNESFNVDFSKGVLRMDTLQMTSSSGAFVELAVPYADSLRQQGSLQGNSINLAPIQEALLKESYVNGILSGEMEFNRTDTTLRADGSIVMSGLSYQELNFDSLSIDGKIDEERLTGSLLVQDQGDELMWGKADVPFRLADPESLPDTFFDESVNGELRIRAIAMERFEPIFEELGFTETSGILTGRADLSGTAGSPQFSARTTLHQAVLSGVELDSVSAAVNYEHAQSVLNLNGSITSLKQTAAELETVLPFYMDFKTFEVTYPDGNDPISANIKTQDFNLAALNDFLDDQTARDLRGSISGNVMLSGPIDSLETNGAFTLRRGGIRIIPLGIRLNEMRSDIHFEKGQMRIAEFTTRSGNGRLNITGTTDFADFGISNMDIRLRTKNFRIANTNEMNAIVNADMRMQGPFYGAHLSGDLEFVSGFYELQNFGEESVENIKLDSETEEELNFSVFDSLSMDMNISFNRRFFVRNSQYLDMEMELDGSLDVVKEKGNDMQLFGTMNTADGYARPLGKRFEIEEGSVIFSGEPTNPQMSVRSMYAPPQTQEEIRIWYIIEGTVEDPKFKYESQPPMELENILSYTLFGQPFYALDSWQQVVTGSGNNTSATTIALDVLLDRVESLATRKLGIDVVRIDNTNTGGQTGTSVTTGWYINPKVFFAIQNVITGSTPNTGFQLEYLLRENLKLMLRQGNGIREGIDLKWEHDY
ncbi:hypothetical protein Asal01_02820 [Fodinibius salicampi]